MLKLKKKESKVGSDEPIFDQGALSMRITSYDDIFSNFDPRHYDHRSLSIDFLDEAKRAVRDKNDEFEIFILVPKEKKDSNKENHIRMRLFEHFKKHHDSISSEVAKIKKQGILMAILGVFMIFIAALLYSSSDSNFLIHFLIVLLEPGGWFTAWTGLDQIYYTANQKRPDLDFYRKMSHATLHFAYY